MMETKNQPEVNTFRVNTTNQSTQTVDLDNLLGEGTATSRVQVDIDMHAVKKLTRFRLFTPFRVFLLLCTIPVFGTSLFFSRLDYRYALVYYIKLFQLQGIYDISYPWSFQRDITYGLIYLGLLIIAFNFFLVIVEMFRYNAKHKLQKVINHLVLRQGIIPVSTLSKVPPKLEPIEYYNYLGKLVVEGVVRLQHVEVSK